MPLNLAAPVKTIGLVKFGGLFTEADPRSLPEGVSPLNWDCDFNVSGVTIRPGLSKAITSFVPASPVPGLFQWLKTAELPASLMQTIAQDTGGRLWIENLTAEGTMTPIYSGILNNARVISDTVNDLEYICLSNLIQGQDQPRHWDGINLDRISQVGPGAGPAPPTITSQSFGIASITEIYPTHVVDTVVWGAQLNTNNAPPPSNNLFFMGVGGDQFFTQGLSVGDYVYVSNVGNLEGQNPNGTYKVTSIGDFTDSNGVHVYFGVTTSVANSDFIRGGAAGQYQKTQALVQLSAPLPQQDAVVGQKITLAGASVQGWNAVWPIIATPTEGQLQINSTQLIGNVAIYNYSLISGEAPGWQPQNAYVDGSQIVSPAGDVWQITTPGTSGSIIPPFTTSPQTDGSGANAATWTKQIGVKVTVIVFNTSNGNGIFNVQGATITSATSSTFTIALNGPNVTAAAEQGSAVSGSGSALIIDPGAVTVGSGNPGTNPIYGNATGGFLLPQNSNVAAGQRYAVCLFLTRNNSITPASPPVAFFTTGSTTAITFTNLPIGPPDVIARIIAMTAAQSGVGGPYFWIPEDVILQASTASLGQTQTVNKTILYDNTSTSLGPLNLNDTVLVNNGTNITEDGNNLLLGRQRELGECVKPVQYAGRTFYLGERTKTDTLINMTFDGGRIPSTGMPAGWTVSRALQASVSLTPSSIFGTSLYIKNNTGAVINPPATPLAAIISLSQTAYQTAFQSPVLAANTAYSFRITLAAPSGVFGGSVRVEFYSPSAANAWGQTVEPLSTILTEVVLPFNNLLWQPMPSDLQLRVYPVSLPVSADLLIDRIEVFPTQQPVYIGQVIGSYFENSEAVDGDTGLVSIQQYTSQPATNHFALRFNRQYYITTADQTFTVVEGNGEPSSWKVDPVADQGCCGPLANDEHGEEYYIIADAHGVYVFDGGNHIKISQEIQLLWNELVQDALSTVWIRNDISDQRILVGVPLPTPNQWLPNAPINLDPTTPNVILMCSYLGCRTGREIAENSAVHVSAFTGNLLWRDMGRKWTIWQISSPIGAYISRADGSEQFWLGQQGVISLLDATVKTDNGAIIPQSYTTYAMSDGATEERLQLTQTRKIYGYASVLIEGSGAFDLTVYPETLDTLYPDTQPAFSLFNPALDDTNIPLNETGNRMFLQLSVDGQLGSWFSCKRVVLGTWPDTHIPISGR